MERNRRYLVVDDDPDDFDFFCEAINELDAAASCHGAGNGEEALLWLRQKIDSLPDYIFLDLNMPRMDGRACLAELKLDSPLKGIPVVIYSTSSDPRDKKETLALGADYFLTKATSFKKMCTDLLTAIKAVGRDRSFGIL